VLSGPWALLDTHDFPTYLDEAIRIFPVPDLERHPRVALDVLELLAVHLGVEQEVVVGIDPHHLGLGMAVGQQRRERREVLPAGQLHHLRVETMVVCVVSHALAYSVRRS